MAIRTHKPTSPGRRWLASDTYEDLTKSKPERALTTALRKRGGRNFRGKITVRHRGGGNRQRLRLMDYRREKHGIPARVVAVEYDPNRSARIALLAYADGEKRYILSPLGVNPGETLMSGPQAEVRPGNSLPLANIPVGTQIHNVELKVGKGGQLARSAGAAAQLLAKEGEYATVRMPSGEVRLVRQECYATIGEVGNVEHGNLKLGKAGRKRHLGIRPTVRGSAMSPRDHPHGGGEGRQPIGMPGPKSPWGKPTKGYKTRNNKLTDKYIVRRRGKKRR